MLDGKKYNFLHMDPLKPRFEVSHYNALAKTCTIVWKEMVNLLKSWAFQITNLHFIFIWKIKIKCFLYTIQKERKQ